MKKEWMPKEFKSPLVGRTEQAESQDVDVPARPAGLTGLHRSIGNQAVQRLIAQRSGGEVDEETAGRIDRARGGGQALDSTVQEQLSASMGHDFGGVQVHTSPEADALNRRLGAQAFTTGQDIFFREGAYDPNSSGGQELIAHELTHVVQQGAGLARGGGGGRMTVNAPGDVHEQQADATAKQVTGTGASVQQQPVEEEEEELQPKAVQLQEEEEEEELQPKAVQLQEEEEEEELQPKAVQRQEADEEEELQPKAVQLQEEEEEELAQPQPIEEEEEMLQPKEVQRQDVPENEHV